MSTVLQVQVQTARLKPLPAKAYDPSPLLVVDAVEVDERGCVGIKDGERVVDVHHADHPDSRNVKLGNGISWVETAAYERARARFGPHLVDGVMGETLLLDERPAEGDLVLGGLLLVDVRPMPPCVGFSRWCARDEIDGEELEAVLSWLSDGARGWTARVVGVGSVTAGDVLIPR